MMRWIIFFVISFFSVLVLGQEEIEYQNRALKRALSKDGVSGFSQISELDVENPVQEQHGVHGKFFAINSDAAKYRYIYTGRVNSCRARGCSASGEKSGDSNPEYFDYFILFDEDKSVRLVKVFNYQATHGYEITSRGWLKQFVGHDGSNSLEVNKDVDAISGATISVRAITADVEMKTEMLQRLKM